MKVTEISYKIHKNLGEYEFEEGSMTAELNDSEDPIASLHTLKETVKLGLSKVEKEKTVVKEEPTVKEEPAKEPAKKVAKKKATKKVAKKKVVKKSTPYDNSNREHKAIVGKLVTELLGAEWRTDTDSRSKVKEASVSMVGTDLIDSDGAILDSFKELLKGKVC